MKLEEFYAICDAIIPDEYGCLIWPRAWSGNYGGVRIKGKMASTHRLALERKLGHPIKRGFHVLHHCDNKSCVNPEHLYQGTHKDNMRDRSQRNHEWMKNSGKHPNSLVSLRIGWEKRRKLAIEAAEREAVWRTAHGLPLTRRIRRRLRTRPSDPE